MVKIWLDAGHGGKDPGAVYGGFLEKTWTLDIDNRIAKLIEEQKGLELVGRTRKTDRFVDSTPRTNAIRNSKANYCISSHINAGGGLGAETIHSIYNDGALAREILGELEEIGLNIRRAFSRKNNSGKDYYFMHRLTGSVTTIIVEYGFIDTKEDREFLSKTENRQKCAEAVVKAICKVEGIKFNARETTKKEESNKEKSLKNKSTYTGNSIVDYLNSIGENSSFSNRKKLAQEYGIRNYKGTASQNIQLLKLMRDTEIAPSNPKQPTSNYKGNSIVDYPKSINVDSSFNSRKKLAEQNGIRNYKGTAGQNAELLKRLRG